MTNFELIEIKTLEGTQEHVIIDRGNGEYTSMPKAVWDELEANRENGTLNNGGLN